jgi:hypothetical protein
MSSESAIGRTLPDGGSPLSDRRPKTEWSRRSWHGAHRLRLSGLYVGAVDPPEPASAGRLDGLLPVRGRWVACFLIAAGFLRPGGELGGGRCHRREPSAPAGMWMEECASAPAFSSDGSVRGSPPRDTRGERCREAVPSGDRAGDGPLPAGGRSSRRRWHDRLLQLQGYDQSRGNRRSWRTGRRDHRRGPEGSPRGLRRALLRYERPPHLAYSGQGSTGPAGQSSSGLGRRRLAAARYPLLRAGPSRAAAHDPRGAQPGGHQTGGVGSPCRHPHGECAPLTGKGARPGRDRGVRPRDVLAARDHRRSLRVGEWGRVDTAAIGPDAAPTRAPVAVGDGG